ncbi:hypothetical protein ASF22_02615 [Methylobacterium sp. Leaf87]|nr:hypothetical protein ASF22_02615 [Methylobacterium sp. Leaf87]
MTRQETVFVKEYARTSDGVYAAAKAGYGSPGPRATQNLQKPAINAAIRAEQEAALHNELVPLALGRLRKILEDDNIAPQHHIAAGKVVLGAAKGTTDTATGKSLSEMSLAETEAMLLALKAEHGRHQAETLEPIEAAPPEHDVMS